MPALDQAHFGRVVRRLLKAQDVGLVTVLGAGVNLWGRERSQDWEPGTTLPDGAELARHLAKRFEYSMDESEWPDLTRVSQYVAVAEGEEPLFGQLRQIFAAPYEPTPLHRLLARVPALLRDRGYGRPHQLLVTTNYDDLLERAFEDENEPFDLVVYTPGAHGHGEFLHFPPSSEPAEAVEREETPEAIPILDPTTYADLLLEDRSIILKIHGACERRPGRADSFVITEDHYIDYLSQSADPSQLIPPIVLQHMRRSAFLFLGYGLRDWNVRVILRRIWGDQELSIRSWAVQRDVDELEELAWGKRNVQLLDVPLLEYVNALETRLQELEPA